MDMMLPEEDKVLLRAPGRVEDASGHPAFGTYVGELPEVELRHLGGAYRLSARERLFKHKRWQYTLLATPEVLVAFVVADLSYTANAFVVAVDLIRRKPLFDAGYLGLPGLLARVGNRPGEGLSAHFRTLGARVSCARGLGRERYEVEVDIPTVPLLREGLSLRGGILAAEGPPALTVISPVADGGLVNVTQKRAGMLALGTLEAGGRTFSLDGGVAGMDYTNGYLARRTAWRWAFGLGRLPDGTSVGLNLVEGFNEGALANENALWVGTRLVPLSRARFHYNAKHPLDIWRITTVDGEVDLRFSPFHVHREERDFKVVRSHFLQPLGIFEGKVRVEGRTLPLQLSGVTEEQDILW